MPRLSLMSPVGELTLVEQDGRLVALTWGPAEAQAETALLKRARRQLDRYFAGQPAPFDLPLGPQGEVQVAAARGLHLHTHSFDRVLDHRDLYPFYALAAERNLPVVVQSGASGGRMSVAA